MQLGRVGHSGGGVQGKCRCGDRPPSLGPTRPDCTPWSCALTRVDLPWCGHRNEFGPAWSCLVLLGPVLGPDVPWCGHRKELVVLLDSWVAIVMGPPESHVTISADCTFTLVTCDSVSSTLMVTCDSVSFTTMNEGV